MSEETKPTPCTPEGIALTVRDRFALLTQLLPGEGSAMTIRTVRRLREACAFEDQSERERVGLVEVPAGFQCKHWDAEKVVPFSSLGRDIVAKSLRKLADDKKLVDADVMKVAFKFLSESEATAMVTTALIRLDKEEKLNDLTLPLFEKYCPDLAEAAA